MARAASALCRALVERGHAVTVVTPRVDGAEVQPSEGLHVVPVDVPRILERCLVPWAPGLPSLLRGLAREAEVAHVHGHRSGLAVAAADAFAAEGVPFVLDPHGTYPDHGQHAFAKRVFDRVAGGRVVRQAAALVAKSAAEVQELPRPALVLANGVSIPAGPPKGPAGSRLLFVGNDRPQKRGLLLPGVLKALPETTLDVAGPARDAWRAAFDGFGPRVRFHGAVPPPALAVLYAAADVVVHPAVGETFGLVPFEAALCGTAAVVAGDHGCGEWYRKAGGTTVAADDVAGLVAGVREVLSDPSRGRDRTAAVAAFASRELTWDAAAQAFESLYSALAKSPRQGAA
jgi:glycosyltransferase involved in cell wall biosynthesis